MYEFLNRALEEHDIEHLFLYPIIVEPIIVFSFINNYNATLLNNIREYYYFKNNKLFFEEAGYYNSIIDTRLTKNDLSKALYNEGFLYYIELFNSSTKRCVSIAVNENTNFFSIKLISNYSIDENFKGLFTEENSCAIRNGSSIPTHFLNIIYEFLENGDHTAIVNFNLINLI